MQDCCFSSHRLPCSPQFIAVGRIILCYILTVYKLHFFVYIETAQDVPANVSNCNICLIYCYKSYFDQYTFRLQCPTFSNIFFGTSKMITDFDRFFSQESGDGSKELALVTKAPFFGCRIFDIQTAVRRMSNIRHLKHPSLMILILNSTFFETDSQVEIFKSFI